MKARRIILKNVRNFTEFDRSFEDAWTGRVPDSLLLLGPNGCGKSTLLNAIADLWQALANHLQESSELPSASLPLMGETLASCDLAALEITGLEDQPLWICMGAQQSVLQFARQQPASHRAAILRSDAPGRTFLQYLAPGAIDSKNAPPAAGWKSRWSERLTRNLLGSAQDLPNLVFLESETRLILPLAERFVVTPEPDDFRWLARYEPTGSRKGSLQNYLYNLKVVDEAAFDEIVLQVNRFLKPKQLNGFDRRTGSLLVKTETGSEHPIELLSSGEKQVLLMTALVTRWLRPGGMVLVDEPDLHLHVSLTTGLVSHLQELTAQKNAQLILASHAPELWRMFTDSHLVRLGTALEKAS